MDAILYTHAHADHILGLDDVRPLNYHQKMSIPAYGTEATLTSSAAFSATPSIPSLRNPPRPAWTCTPSRKSHSISSDCASIPIPLMHGRGVTLGFRFGDAAYLTDHSDIPEASKPLLRNLDVLFLDALRHRPHPTHSTVEQSLESVQRTGAARAFFTHICHDLPHAQTEAALPAQCAPRLRRPGARGAASAAWVPV